MDPETQKLMMQQQLLEQLRDVHAPEAIGWWPLAPGWWVLMFLVLAALVSLGLLLRARYKANEYRRHAVIVAEHIYRNYEEENDSATYLNQVNQLLRRVLASLNGTASAEVTQWVSQLDAFAPSPLTESLKKALSEEAYQPQPSTDIQTTHSEILLWLKQHRRKAAKTNLSKTNG